MRAACIAIILAAAVVHGQETTSPPTVINGINATTIQPNFTVLSQTDPTKVRIRDIQALTFKAGRLAIRRRSTPVEQLRCVHDCYGELPTAAQCKNEGFDGISVSWRCQAKVTKGRSIMDTSVRCEAFTEGDREYILAGSCILEYGLGGRSSSSGGGRGYPPAHSPSDGRSKNPFQFIVPIIMIIILIVVICAVAKACRRSRESSGVVMGAPPGQAGGYHGGGAYPAQPGFNPAYAQPGYAAPMAAPMQSGGGGNALGAGLGGFAAGAATGGLLGYMMGNHGSSNHGYGGGYGSYGGGGGGDYNAGDMGGGGGYEMSTDFADTVME